MDMGPSGHPFEHFVGELLRAQGYVIQISQIVQGACVAHEIDVVAEKDYTLYHNFHYPGSLSSYQMTFFSLILGYGSNRTVTY
jgi:hypothetical protein